MDAPLEPAVDLSGPWALHDAGREHDWPSERAARDPDERMLQRWQDDTGEPVSISFTPETPGGPVRFSHQDLFSATASRAPHNHDMPERTSP
jgi:hypothetical protein